MFDDRRHGFRLRFSLKSIWISHNDLTATSLEWWLDCGESFPNDRKFQVSELLWFSQINGLLIIINDY